MHSSLSCEIMICCWPKTDTCNGRLIWTGYQFIRSPQYLTFKSILISIRTEYNCKIEWIRSIEEEVVMRKKIKRFYEWLRTTFSRIKWTNGNIVLGNASHKNISHINLSQLVIMKSLEKCHNKSLWKLNSISGNWWPRPTKMRVFNFSALRSASYIIAQFIVGHPNATIAFV